MLIAGIILIAIAAVAFFVGRGQRSREREATATETMSCADIGALAGGVGAEVGGGAFHQRCEVVGQAAPGEAGLLRAEYSGAEAVWTRSAVYHEYWEMQTETVNGETRRKRVDRSEVVSDISSSTPFAVSDGTGQVAVAPEDAKVDHPEQILDRFEPRGGGGPASAFSSFVRSGGNSGTLGFRYREWILRPGARLWVHGEVSDATGRLAFAKPSEGRYIISTRSEEQIVGAARRNAGIAHTAAAVAGIAGVVLVVLGALL
jgi:E3 Ubiquitin ligase